MIPESQNAAQQPKVHIETWGCQMNVSDSEHMFALLKNANYTHVQEADEADLIILNTCHIREKAYHKVLSRLGVLRSIKDKKPKLKVVVAGCVAQAEGKRLLSDNPTVDIVIGPSQIAKLPSLLEESKAEDGSPTPNKRAALGFKVTDAERMASPLLEESYDKQRTQVSRFVNIQQGCNNFCTFCVVPYTRGSEVSEAPNTIVDKVERLVASGVKEITLLGQNVNSYGTDLVKKAKLTASAHGPFVDLLARVAEVPGLASLRLTTSNPHDFTKPLADLYAKKPILGRYFHLPVQSGSDRILAAMKRKVTVAEYHQRVSWLREAVKDMALSTDLIVGFPGETEEDFEATLELVRVVEFSFVYAFAYSKRKGTAARRFADQVPETTMSKRLQRLNKLQDGITTRLNQAEIGSTHPVLVHYKSKKEADVYYGRTPHFRLVKIPCSRDIVGQVVGVEIIDANKTALLGRVI